MTSRRPGDIDIEFRLSGQDAADLIRMAKDAGKHRNGLSAFARSIVLEVIADDRAAHAGHAGVDRQVSA